MSNPTNSFKSLCSLAKGAPVALDQLEEHVHSLLRSEVCIVILVRAIRVRETVEDSCNALHK